MHDGAVDGVIQNGSAFWVREVGIIEEPGGDETMRENPWSRPTVLTFVDLSFTEFFPDYFFLGLRVGNGPIVVAIVGARYLFVSSKRATIHTILAVSLVFNEFRKVIPYFTSGSVVGHDFGKGQEIELKKMRREGLIFIRTTRSRRSSLGHIRRGQRTRSFK
jgi:hypothetical protein